MQLVSAVVAGALLGILGGRYVLVGSWLSLVPWTIAGLALGAWATRSRCVLVGAPYGFALLFAFMMAGYTGAASLLSRVPFFAVIGVAGAVYGVVVTWLGAHLRRSQAPGGSKDAA